MNKEIAQKISDIMGCDAVIPEKKVARVHCAGTFDKCGQKYDFLGIDDCYTASKLRGGPKECEYGCLGLGTCVNECSFGALSIVDGIATVDEEKCTGCGKCESVCPKNVIRLEYAKNKLYVKCLSKDKGVYVKDICKSGCIGCKMCEKKCEFGAITVVDNVARIDYNKCTSCGVCASVCPKKIIVYKGE